jgi:predicted alpha/beta hydrolase
MTPPARFTFPATDGTPLTGTLYVPAGAAVAADRPSVLIAGALGVGQRHYAAFAAWLAQRGHVAAPLLVPLFGCFPGKRMRMVADLSAPAMRQWSRWCRHPQFAWGAEPELVKPNFLAARFPVTALSFSDDEAMTAACTQKLLDAFSHAPTRLIRIAPGDVGLQRIGHLGAFRPDRSVALWERLADAIAETD